MLVDVECRVILKDDFGNEFTSNNNAIESENGRELGSTIIVCNKFYALLSTVSTLTPKITTYDIAPKPLHSPNIYFSEMVYSGGVSHVG